MAKERKDASTLLIGVSAIKVLTSQLFLDPGNNLL